MARIADLIAAAVALVLLGPWAALAGMQAAPDADAVPAAQWDHVDQSDQWSHAALDALRDHGEPLVEETPEDIAQWCPGYASGTDADRRAFWVGFLSTLARYESTWRPDAVGGGDRWFGLLQIGPATARAFGCRGRSGSALKDGATNLSCAIRILATTVPRDGVISARDPDWSGVAADWAPLRSDEKRAEMRGWLRGQDYCQPTVGLRPLARPDARRLAWLPL